MPIQAEIQLPPQLKDALAQGHPWVYRNHIAANIRLVSGTWVRLRCANWQGYGIWDATSPIAVRVFGQQLPDPAFVKQRVREAWELRAPLRGGTTAYRWLFGEGDGLPGIAVDLYGEYAVVATYLNGSGELIDWLLPALRATAPLRGIVLRHRPFDGDAPIGRDDDVAEPAKMPKTTILWGAGPPRDLVIEETGLRFEADLRGGQKTGLFLDHRENRRYVETISAGRDVLNCFAYTGGFSLYALRGGARHVVSADIGKGLDESAATNISLSGLDGSRHTFVTEDCFALLDRYANERRSFDLVILDPPSFAKNKQSRYAAIRAYTRLNALALRCLRPGGTLATASCTSQVGPEVFKEVLAAAAVQAKRRLQIIHEAGQPLDHPVPPQFPEGRYLKFVVLRAL